MDKIVITKFIDSQKSLHLYKNLQNALFSVLSRLEADEYEVITHNLIIMALDDNATAQVMHFKPIKEKFRILQITVHSNLSNSDLEYVIAHEFGHIIQGRNWQEDDGLKLEEDADNWAVSHGYTDTRKIKS